MAKVDSPSVEEVNRGWYAMLEGRYEEALQVLDSVIQRTGEATGFKVTEHNLNRGIARLMLGDTHGALADFRQYRDRPNPPKVPIPFVGATLWLQGHREAACEDWAYEISRRRSGEITHCDEAGAVEVPVLLWWATAHSGLEGWRELAIEELQLRDRNLRRRKWPRRVQERWPGTLAPFLLGKSPEEALLRFTEDFGPFMAARRCGAHFYLGARYLDAGDLSEYRRRLGLAVSQGEISIVQPEYHLACAELVALG